MLIQRQIRTGWNERCGIVDGASTLNQRTAKSSCLTGNNRYPSHKINLSVRGVDIAQDTWYIQKYDFSKMLLFKEIFKFEYC